jgi:outer membrane cobalamin receptor
MKRLSVLIPLTFLFFIPSLRAVERAAVSGSAVDPSGRTVPGVSVQLSQSTGAAVLTARSDQDGRFAFTNVTPGEYLLTASTETLALPDPITIHVSKSTNEQLTIHLALTAQRNQVTVTAAALPQSVDLVSKALDVVRVDEAERRGVFTVADAVRQVPGLRITTRGGPGAFTTIQTRGLRATDTAILIDGFRFRDNTGVQGDASAFISDLFLVDSSRIEVLRGSGSSLYGTNSMSGTINVITDQGGGAPHGDLDYQGGGLGLNRGLARVAGGAFGNRLTYSAGLAHLNEINGVNGGGAARNWSGQGGANVAITPALRIGGRVLADSHYLQFQTIPSALGPASGAFISAVPPASSQLKLANAGLPYSTAGATFLPALNDPDARVNGSFVSGLFHVDEQATSRLALRFSVQSSKTHRDNDDGPGGPGIFQPLFRTSDLYDGRVDTAQARADYIAAPWQLITAGYEWEREQYANLGRDSNPDPLQRTYSYFTAVQKSNAVFAQDQLQLFRGRLLVLLSGRFQNFQLAHPRFYGGDSPYAGVRLPSPANAYTGDASLAYFFHKSATKVRAHVGNSFRQPSIYERFGTYFFGGFYSPYGDPRLSPERAVSADGGIDQYLWREKIRLSGTFFYTRLQQVISFDLLGLITPATDPYGRFGGYFNTGGGLAHGVETSAELRPTRRTVFEAAYTYTNARDRISQFNTGTGMNPIQTPRIIPHLATFRASQDITKHLQIGADLVAGSRFLYPISGRAYRFRGPRQLGLSANYTIPVSEGVNVRLYTRVWNALDQNYFDDAFQTPGRWAVGGIRISF